MKFYFFLGLLLGFCHCRPSYAPDDQMAAKLPDVVDFNFHIKPILSDRCFPCHGPDKNALEGDLRLHLEGDALNKTLSSGQRAFVPFSPRQSEAHRRMRSADPEQQMPPPEFQRRVTPYEIALVAKWIDQGAEYKQHWAFIEAVKSPVPELEGEDWCRNPIDAFVLKKLQDNNRSPVQVADREMLLRRVTFDLTGLPPTIEEIDDFVGDRKPNAYEKVVDRLLASPHFGERMALGWLDLARYADSNGYSQDGLRIMWPWRDWIIKAFNENMPYDQFVAWQIAGDKMPDATAEQILATGFLRNHRLNGEGGIIDEEYRVEYAADRTETTATAFLGLTMQCARCHDHKYDPISQEEYYQFFGFFNNVNESGITANDGNSGPELVLTNEEVEAQMNLIDRLIETENKKAREIARHIDPSQWKNLNLNLQKGLLVDLDFEKINTQGFSNNVNKNEFFPVEGTVNQEVGAKGKAFRFSAFDVVSLTKDELNFGRSDAFSFSFYLKNRDEISSTSILNHLGSKAINYPGYEIAIRNGYPMIRLVHSLPAVLMEIRGDQPIKGEKWEHLVFTYDGSGQASGMDIYLNGQKGKKIIFDQLTQGIGNAKTDLTIGGLIAYQTKVEDFGWIDELKIYDRALSTLEAKSLFLEGGRELSAFSLAEQKEHILKNQHPVYGKTIGKIQHFRKEKFEIQDTLVSVMVMQDLPRPRPTFVLDRGVYNAPGKRVYPATPSAVSSYQQDGSLDRSGLASWLFDTQNPLTSRVAVNRFWQSIFGTGIVKTLEDFGNQGALPSHPELLDWLAVTFRESNWDIKELFRMMVLSATYRQTSHVSRSDRMEDPDNRLLGRGPSTRLSAELIRDCALAASGLLDKRIGGPSVKPYQPPGLWSEKGEFSVLKNYEQGHGPDLYRRSLYTFWRRTSPPPSMTTFDAPTRDICIVSRQSTNTPLQALVLQNDPQFVEAARVLASKVLRSHPKGNEGVIRAYRLLTGTHPNSEVVDLLTDLNNSEHQKFIERPALVSQLMQVGEHPADKEINGAKVAALTLVVSTIMSFDETLTKR